MALSYSTVALWWPWSAAAQDVSITITPSQKFFIDFETSALYLCVYSMKVPWVWTGFNKFKQIWTSLNKHEQVSTSLAQAWLQLTRIWQSFSYGKLLLWPVSNKLFWGSKGSAISARFSPAGNYSLVSCLQCWRCSAKSIQHGQRRKWLHNDFLSNYVNTKTPSPSDFPRMA